MDYSTGKVSSRLREKVLGNDESIHSSFAVNEVAGAVDTARLQAALVEKCGAEETIVDASCMLDPG